MDDPITAWAEQPIPSEPAPQPEAASPPSEPPPAPQSAPPQDPITAWAFPPKPKGHDEVQGYIGKVGSDIVRANVQPNSAAIGKHLDDNGIIDTTVQGAQRDFGLKLDKDQLRQSMIAAAKQQTLEGFKQQAGKDWRFAEDDWSGRGIVKSLAERAPFSTWDVAKYIAVGNAANRIKSDKADYNDYRLVAEFQAEQEREDRKGVVQKGVESLTHIPALAAEFALTGGTASVERIGAILAAKKAAQIGIKEALAGIAKETAKGVLKTTALNPVALAKGYEQQRLPEIDPATGEAGKQKDVGEAASNAAINTAIGNLGFLLMGGVPGTIGKGGLAEAATGTAKAIGVSELTKEAELQATSTGKGSTITRIAKGDPDALKDLASELVAFGGAEFGMAAMRQIQNRGQQLRSQGVRPGSSLMQKELAKEAEKLMPVKPAEEQTAPETYPLAKGEPPAESPANTVRQEPPPVAEPTGSSRDSTVPISADEKNPSEPADLIPYTAQQGKAAQESWQQPKADFLKDEEVRSRARSYLKENNEWYAARVQAIEKEILGKNRDSAINSHLRQMKKMEDSFLSQLHDWAQEHGAEEVNRQHEAMRANQEPPPTKELTDAIAEHTKAASRLGLNEASIKRDIDQSVQRGEAAGVAQAKAEVAATQGRETGFEPADLTPAPTQVRPDVPDVSVLGKLKPQERDILERRFGMTGDAQTLEEIGKSLGLTRERIRQIEAKALEKLGATVKSIDQLRPQQKAEMRAAMEERQVQKGGGKKVNVASEPPAEEGRRGKRDAIDRLESDHNDIVSRYADDPSEENLKAMLESIAKVKQARGESIREIQDAEAQSRRAGHSQAAIEKTARSASAAAKNAKPARSGRANAARGVPEVPAPDGSVPGPRSGGDEAGRISVGGGGGVDAAGRAGAAPRADRLTPEELADRYAAEGIIPGKSTAMPANFGTQAPAAGGRVAEALGKAKETLAAGFREIRDNWKEFAGSQFPRTARLSDDSADAMVHYSASLPYSQRAAPFYARMVLDSVHDYRYKPEELTAKDRKQNAQLFMDAFHEERSRYARDAYHKLADQFEQRAAAEKDKAEKADLLGAAKEARDKANNVGTFIGALDSELGSEAKYKETINSRGYKEFMDRWQKYMVPMMDAFYKKAQGMETDDPINSLTQIPGRPVNFKAIQGDEANANILRPTGSKSGDLRNSKLRKYGFAEPFTGAASKGYDTNPVNVIENSIYQAAKAATKAEMYRALERNGQLKWGKPGDKIEFNGEPGKVIPDINPPKGTQAAGDGENRAYVDPKVFLELKKVLDLNDRVHIPFVTPAAKMATNISLASLVEATTHSKNLLTSLWKPGVHPLDVMQSFLDVIRNDPKAEQRAVELAEMGAMKPKGPEAGNNLVSRFTGKVLDVVDTSMRLTADKAFERLKSRGWAVDTEANRRDFINQLGQYNRLSQNWAVQGLRDSGIGPFATAGTNFTAQGIRGILLSPGAKATGFKGEVAMRAEMAAKIGVLMGLTAVTNYLAWGNAFGDDNTPLGSVKLGTGSNGKTISFDLASFAGLPRGARTIGLLAMLEGTRTNAPAGAMTSRARDDAIGGLIHPAMGPIVNFGLEAATGKNSIGIPTAPDVNAKGFTTSFGAVGRNQQFQDALGAVKNLNPMLSAFFNWSRPRTKDEPTPLERASQIVGPFAPKFRKSPPVPAEERRTITVPVRK